MRMDLAEWMKTLHLAEKSAISLEELDEDFVLDVALQNRNDSGLIAATSSNYTIRLFSKTTLVSSASIRAHNDVITGVRFSHDEPDILYSSSMDKTVKSWDLRTNQKKPVQTFEGYADPSTKFCSFDENCNGRLLCAGSEATKSEDVYLLYWDRRKGEILGAYTESHQDDITQVCFHPTQPDSLATGSTDGLVNIFDVSQTCEDDALQFTLNSESSVARVGWCGEKMENVFCVTHVDTYHMWETVEGDSLTEILDMKDRLKGSVDYLVDCVCIDDQSQPVVVAGTHSGDLKLLDVTGKTINVTACLSGGHKATVRTVVWDKQSDTLVTGGEDSLLCLWSTKDTPKNTTPRKAKLKSRKEDSRRSKPYKSRT